MKWTEVQVGIKCTPVLIGALLLSITANAEDKIDLNTKERAAEKSICNNLKSESETWFDETHTYLSVQFCEPAAWFDSFFSSERTAEEFRPGSRVRWRNDFFQQEGKGLKYDTSLSASFKLPNLKKSVNIIFEDDEDESLEDVIPTDEGQNTGNFGLLYEVTKSSRANLSLKLKLSPSALLRYRYTWPLSPTFITRFTQELFRRDSSNGATTRIDFEKKLSDNLSFRQSNSTTTAENIDGREWNASFVVLQRLSDVSALSYESGTNGVTEPDHLVKNVRLGVRYRKNFYRSWLFYELAPAVTWPKKDITEVRVPVWEFLFRLEVNFVNL